MRGAWASFARQQDDESFVYQYCSAMAGTMSGSPPSNSHGWNMRSRSIRLNLCETLSEHENSIHTPALEVSNVLNRVVGTAA